jgi:hypothetical protein
MEVEQEALALGWVPQDQFRGDPARWVDAESFVTRGKEIMPILRKNNEKLVGTVESLSQELGTIKQQLADAAESMAEFKAYHDETAKRAYEQAVRDLKAQKKEALAEGDHDRVIEIDEGLADLRDQAPRNGTPRLPTPAPTPAPTQQVLDPVLREWMAENNVDAWTTEQKVYAQSAATFLRGIGNRNQGKAFLNDVKVEVEKRFNQTPNGKSVEGGGGKPPRSGRSFDALPAEAKDACDRMGARLVGKGRAFETQADWRKKYTADYFGSEA